VSPAPVAVDAAALAIVLRNLLANALRYAPDGGRVDVATFARSAVAVLEITDNGPGIAPSDIDRVLDPFKRAPSARGEGAGLGLAIVNRIVTSAGGTLTLTARGDGQDGLCVSATFPLADARSAVGR
jgi:signal transduction histidine kinase